MSASQERDLNRSAYSRLKEMIARTYPFGRFVAISQGQIVADAATFQELDSALLAQGNDSRETLVIQAGVEYPEKAVILTQGPLS
jgi:hypothetical protein